jgi:O-antigen/teichoic acid export membrane protein
MRNITTVIKDFFIYSFGAIAVRGITFILAPLILRKISPQQYGTLSLLNSFIGILASLAGLGLRQVLFIEYFHQDATNRKRMINDIIIIYICAALPIFLFLYYYRTIWSVYIFNTVVQSPLLTLGLLSAFLFFFSELFSQVLRYEQKSGILTLLQLIIALTNGSLTVFFLFFLDGGIISIVAAQCIGTAVACSTAAFLFFKHNYHLHAIAKKSIQKARYYIGYGLPFVPGILFSWILSSGDKWLLARYATMHDVGIYSIADMFGQLFQLFILYPWSGAYLPYILNQFVQNKENIKQVAAHNNRNMYWSMFAVTILIIASYLLSTSLLLWFLPQTYHAAISYIWIILLGYVFLLGSYFASSLIQFYKKTYFLAFALAIPAVLNLILNYFFIPRWGIYGCTSATLIAYVVYFLITFIYSESLK